MDESLSGTNWSNIDLSNPLERDKNILDPISFERILLEVNCNLPKEKVNRLTVTNQFMESLNSAVNSAVEVFRANLDNIINYDLKERD